MKPLTSPPERMLNLVTLVLSGLVAVWGIVMVFFVIEPFWIDEWRLIGNLKLRPAAALWGPLDYTQQFPRVFLQLWKRFSDALDYSYISLRLPSLVLSCLSMILSFRLMLRIYPELRLTRYLFVWILISSETFTDYLVQTKQYEMELLLSLVAIWQLLELLRLGAQGAAPGWRYLLLCISFLLVPYCSYTYPVAIAAVYLVVGLQTLSLFRQHTPGRWRTSFYQWFPLVLGALSILVFYLADVRQLMEDESMRRYWAYRMVGEGTGVGVVLLKVWSFFAEVGSGSLFEIIFGVLGILAFGYGLFAVIKRTSIKRLDPSGLIHLYAVALIGLVILLFLAGKIPVGEPKFNAFTVPSIAILIILLLDRTATNRGRVTTVIATILYLGLAGNVIFTIVNSFTSSNHQRQLLIYDRTQKAIKLAQERKLPIYITPGVAWPDEITREVPFLVTLTADVVLKCWPAYPVRGGVPVIPISDSIYSQLLQQQQNTSGAPALIGNGVDFHTVRVNPVLK